MIVIVLYLLFTIFEADWQLRRQGDFYTILGVLPSADERVIQSRFRKLYVGRLRYYGELLVERQTHTDDVQHYNTPS